MVNPVSAATANDLAGPKGPALQRSRAGQSVVEAGSFWTRQIDRRSHARRRSRRHLIRAMTTETSVPGVYAAGDVRAGSTKRCATAVGEGAMVVKLIHGHIRQQGAVIQGAP